MKEVSNNNVITHVTFMRNKPYSFLSQYFLHDKARLTIIENSIYCVNVVVGILLTKF